MQHRQDVHSLERFLRNFAWLMRDSSVKFQHYMCRNVHGLKSPKIVKIWIFFRINLSLRDGPTERLLKQNLASGAGGSRRSATSRQISPSFTSDRHNRKFLEKYTERGVCYNAVCHAPDCQELT